MRSETRRLQNTRKTTPTMGIYEKRNNEVAEHEEDDAYDGNI